MAEEQAGQGNGWPAFNASTGHEQPHHGPHGILVVPNPNDSKDSIHPSGEIPGWANPISEMFYIDINLPSWQLVLVHVMGCPTHIIYLSYIIYNIYIYVYIYIYIYIYIY